MILYLDTSAFVPLLIDEQTSQTCGALWDAADRLVTTRLTNVEAAAALAMAERLGRISSEEHDAARKQMASLWSELDIMELDEQLMADAARAARTHGLRGYDSVHFAAAGAVDDESLVAAAGDQRLLEAWRTDGIAVVDTSTPSPADTSQEVPTDSVQVRAAGQQRPDPSSG
ncbi:type II toxin-antitoxin system VapC family toxin [Ornithinimicrobium faecis]|uniref:Ribonuclease VapC n=1 Tax=Ornithinimicrobium faecis TaxID=2934158 RepID=A0ABY4YZ70_9MICO|nr:type II toxin-antitoxin system VapC family toxin [Ornithinimicrobium sp. HY1793]USQ81560.1 type II toxin-antitoxin system VapC family toxin [Ornithinimicrobium sp. HY1793]